MARSSRLGGLAHHRALSLGDLGRPERLVWLGNRLYGNDLRVRRKCLLQRRSGLLRRTGDRDRRGLREPGRYDRRQRTENLNPAASEWLPLGVFAVTQDRQATGPVPTLFMQLAVNKEGVIAGTFKNETTGETQSLEGMVDKKSQRVAWCVQGKSWPIVETGLSNLTQETFPALLHFSDGQTQQWLFVRLEEPKKTS